MTHSYIAYVDESGQQGGTQDRGASEFIIIAAAVCRVEEEPDYDKLLADVRKDFKKPPGWVIQKFSDAGSDLRRFHICNKIGNSPVGITAILAHKPTIWAEPLLTVPGALYLQLSQYLVERISWICRDDWRDFSRSPSAGSGQAEIIFSECKTLRYETFASHVRTLAANPMAHNSYAAWYHIDPNAISALPHRTNRAGLLIADYIASAFGRAVERKEFGITDDRFVRLFRTRVYNWNGKHLGNGIKIWPQQAEALVETDERLSWLKHYYGR